MDAAETDVLADMGFPAAHRAKLHSTNPLERLNGEIKRRTEVVGIVPDERSIRRLVGAILLEETSHSKRHASGAAWNGSFCSILSHHTHSDLAVLKQSTLIIFA